MRARVVVPAAALVLALGAAGCGGDDEEETTATEPAVNGATGPAGEEGAAQNGAAGAVDTVGMVEYEFNPSDVTAEQGSTITAENNGEIVHNLTVQPQGNGENLIATPDVDPGDSAELEVAIDPGTYRMVCTIPGHEELGMVGTFTVE